MIDLKDTVVIDPAADTLPAELFLDGKFYFEIPVRYFLNPCLPKTQNSTKRRTIYVSRIFRSEWIFTSSAGTIENGNCKFLKDPFDLPVMNV